MNVPILDSQTWQAGLLSRGTTLEAVPDLLPICFKYYHLGGGYPDVLNLTSVNSHLIKDFLTIKTYDKWDLTHACFKTDHIWLGVVALGTFM